MATVGDIKKSIALRVQDPAKQVVTDALLLQFINDAAKDAESGGWLSDLSEDTSITLTQGQADYDVPANFAYIKELFFGTNRIEQLFWRLVLVSGMPKIRFDTRVYSIQSGTLTVVGYKKPKTNYVDDAETIDASIDSFLRERATAYAASYLGRSGTQVSQRYEQLFQDAWAISSQLLQDRQVLQQAFFGLNELRRVPGR